MKEEAIERSESRRTEDAKRAARSSSERRLGDRISQRARSAAGEAPAVPRPSGQAVL